MSKVKRKADKMKRVIPISGSRYPSCKSSNDFFHRMPYWHFGGKKMKGRSDRSVIVDLWLSFIFYSMYRLIPLRVPLFVNKVFSKKDGVY